MNDPGDNRESDALRRETARRDRTKPAQRKPMIRLPQPRCPICRSTQINRGRTRAIEDPTHGVLIERRQDCHCQACGGDFILCWEYHP